MAVDPLAGVHPDLVAKVRLVTAALAAINYPIVVTAGVRTDAEQIALYAKGRTAPGPIVTYTDGIEKKSKHQVQADGFGHAIDCAFLVDGAPSWDLHLPWAAYGALAQALGLVWGGRWTRLHDLPHVELP